MRKVGNAESGHEAVSIISPLEYLNVHFPTFLLSYFCVFQLVNALTKQKIIKYTKNCDLEHVNG